MSAPLSNISIVLVRPQHSGNIGAIARSIANHGLGKLYLVDPPAFDPDIARWMAPNAHQVINEAQLVPDIPSAIHSASFVVGASARNRKWDMQTIELPTFFQKSLTQESIAILFGPEDSGLSNHDLQYCHAMISLPTHEHKSLNLSQAVNVFGGHLLHHYEQQSQNNTALPEVEKSSAAMQLRFVESTKRLLETIDFFDGNHPIHFHHYLLKSLEKSQLSNKDISFLKKITDKLYHSWRTKQGQ